MKNRRQFVLAHESSKLVQKYQEFEYIVLGRLKKL